MAKKIGGVGGPGTPGGPSGDDISSKTEGEFRSILDSKSKNSTTRAQALERMIRKLPPSEAKLLRARLNDPNDDLKKLYDEKVNVVQRNLMNDAFAFAEGSGTLMGQNTIQFGGPKPFQSSPTETKQPSSPYGDLTKVPSGQGVLQNQYDVVEGAKPGRAADGGYTKAPAPQNPPGASHQQGAQTLRFQPEPTRPGYGNLPGQRPAGYDHVPPQYDKVPPASAGEQGAQTLRFQPEPTRPGYGNLPGQRPAGYDHVPPQYDKVPPASAGDFPTPPGIIRSPYGDLSQVSEGQGILRSGPLQPGEAQGYRPGAGQLQPGEAQGYRGAGQQPISRGYVSSSAANEGQAGRPQPFPPGDPRNQYVPYEQRHPGTETDFRQYDAAKFAAEQAEAARRAQGQYGDLRSVPDGEGLLRDNHGASPLQPGEAQGYRPGGGSLQPGEAQGYRPGGGPLQPGEAQGYRPGSGQLQPGEAQGYRPGGGQLQPGEAQGYRPGVGPLQPGEAQGYRPGGSQLQPGEAQGYRPGSGQLQPGEAQGYRGPFTTGDLRNQYVPYEQRHPGTQTDFAQYDALKFVQQQAAQHPAPEGPGPLRNQYGRADDPIGPRQNQYGRADDPIGPRQNQYGRADDPIGPRPNQYDVAPDPLGPKPNQYGRADDPIGPRPNQYDVAPDPLGPKPNQYGRAEDPIGPRPNQYDVGADPLGSKQNQYGRADDALTQRRSGQYQQLNLAPPSLRSVNISKTYTPFSDSPPTTSNKPVAIRNTMRQNVFGGKGAGVTVYGMGGQTISSAETRLAGAGTSTEGEGYEGHASWAAGEARARTYGDGKTLWGAEAEASAFRASAGGHIEAELAPGVTGYATGETEFQVGGRAQAVAGVMGDGLQASAAAFVGARADAQGAAGVNVDGIDFGGFGMGHADAGAGAAADASFGLKGAHVGANAFAGASTGGSAGFMAAGLGATVGGEAWAGIGFRADASAGLVDGKFTLNFTLGAALGVGGCTSFGIAIDVRQIEKDFEAIAPAFEEFGHMVEKDAERIGKAANDAADKCASDVTNTWNQAQDNINQAVQSGDTGKVIEAAVVGAANTAWEAVSSAAEVVGTAIAETFAGY